jgi:hypothetical protein
MNNSTSYPGHKLNINSPVYPQYKIHHDRIPSTSSCSAPSSSYNYCRYPPTAELALPTPVSSLSSHASSPAIIPPHTIGASSSKTKVNIARRKKKKKNQTFIFIFNLKK